MLNQKTAVYNAIKEVKTFEDGSVVELSKDEKATVKSILVTGFEEGKIELKSAQDDLGKYVNGLINNWLRKDTRMNGGQPYEIKNKGSRTGQSDPMIKNLRLLKKREGLSEADVAEIDQAIATRLAEIKPAKAAAEIDVSAIPEEFQHLV